MASDLANILRGQQAGAMPSQGGMSGFSFPWMQMGQGNPFQFTPTQVGSPAQPSGAWGPLMGGLIQGLPFTFQKMFPWLSPSTMQSIMGGAWNSMQGQPKNTASLDGKPSGMAPTQSPGLMGMGANPLLFGKGM